MRVVGPGEYRAEHDQDMEVAYEVLGEMTAARERAMERIKLIESAVASGICAKRMLELHAPLDDVQRKLVLATLGESVLAAGHVMESLTRDAHDAGVAEELWEGVVEAGPMARRP